MLQPAFPLLSLHSTTLTVRPPEADTCAKPPSIDHPACRERFASALFRAQLGERVNAPQPPVLLAADRLQATTTSLQD
jgi:hypothetical protein